MAENAGTPPLSHKVRVATLSHVPLEITLSANEAERLGLAELWDILGVDALEASLKVRRWKKEGVKVTGEVSARVSQACVVTLEPVGQEIDEDIDETFAPEGSSLLLGPGQGREEIVIDAEAAELPEPFAGDEIDVGAMVAELVAMALDPYPRKPGAAFSDHIEMDARETGKPSPFAVLKSLKGGD